MENPVPPSPGIGKGSLVGWTERILNNMKKMNENSKVTLTMKQLKKLVKENIANADSIDIRLGSGGGYYGGKSNIHIHATDEGDREAGWDLIYEFSQPGWDFETTYQLEAAAVIAGSKFWKDEQLAEVPAEKENLDQQWADAAYWCSGGNALWKFGQDEDFVGNWNESKDEVEKLFRERYEKDVLACSNLLEIVAVMKKAKDNFLTVLYDECPELWDYDDYADGDEEVEVEPTDESKKAVKEGFDTEDGWDCDEIRDSGLLDTLRKCVNLQYTLDKCTRASANFGETLGDLKAYVTELAEEMQNAVASFPDEDEEDEFQGQDAMGDDEEIEVMERIGDTVSDADVRELVLYITNDSGLYHRYVEPIIANLRKKVKKGIYNPELAVKLWKVLADEGAKKYDKELNDGRGRVDWLNVPTRLAIAKELRDYYQERVDAVDEVSEGYHADSPGKRMAVGYARELERETGNRNFAILTLCDTFGDHKVIDALANELDDLRHDSETLPF